MSLVQRVNSARDILCQTYAQFCLRDMRAFVLIALVAALGAASASSKLMVPESFGDYNLTSCSGAPACGVAMASEFGVDAKSNGGDQCTGNCCGGDISTGCAYQVCDRGLEQTLLHCCWVFPHDVLSG